jgi:serine/threonine protein kinase
MVAEMLADRYEIIEVIGEGGMGVVYKARHVLMKRVVAIKMLHESLIANELTRKRFEQEAQAISALNHPNILTVYDFGITKDNKPYLVVEFLEGTNLAELLEKENHLSEQRALHIFKQACSGLAHAHDKGIVHRDIKPSNFMLVKMGTDEEFVKIVDFGIAKLVQEGQKDTIGLTTTGEIFGSPLYMSPEQCCGRSVDARSDIYSLGCVMYFTLTGHSPFAAENVPACLYKHVHETPEKFAEVNPEVVLSPALEGIVFKAMEKEAESRYQSMVDFGKALNTYESGSASFAELLDDAKQQSQAASVEPKEQPQPITTQAADVTPSSSNSITDAPIVSAKPFSFPIPLAFGAAVLVLGTIGALVWNLFPYNHNYAQSYAQYKQEAAASFQKGDFGNADRLYTLAYHEAQKLPNSAVLLQSTADLLYKTYIAESKYEKLALLAITQRDYLQGVEILNTALHQAEKQYGQNSKEVAGILSPLAKLYEKQGDYAKAEAAYTQALNIKKGIHQFAANEGDGSMAKALQKRYSDFKRVANRAKHTPAKEKRPAVIAHPEQAMYDHAARSIPAEHIAAPTEVSAEETPKKRGVIGSVGHGIKKMFGIFGHHKDKPQDAQ